MKRASTGGIFSTRCHGPILRFVVFLAVSCVGLTVSAQTTYYWDNNGSTAGFGTASGTWAASTTGDSTQGWSTSSVGTLVPSNVTTSTSDAVNFGTSSNGLAAGTIALAGNPSAGSLAFGSASGAITLSGNLTLASSGAITVDNSVATITGAIAGLGSSLTKTGTGTLTLSGSNTFTGDITINAGKLVASNSGDIFGNSGALGNVKVARTITVNSGAALSFAAANVTGQADTTPAATLVVNAGGVVNGATNQYNSLGPVTLVGGTINTLGGFSSSYGGFGLRGTVTTLASSATATLASPSGANSFYNLLASGTFNVADGAAATDLLVSGAISGAGSVALTKTGAGTMELSGNNTFTGDITINAGTLVASNSGDNFGNSGALGNVKVARTITVNSGAALSFAAANVTGQADTTPAATLVVNAGGVVNGATNQYNSLGPVTLVGGTINTLGGYSSSYGGFGLRGTVTTLASSATATLASPSGANSFYNLLASGTFNVADGAAATDLLVSGAISGAGSVALTKTGAGTMELSGNNTFTGDITINAGTLVASNSGDNSGNSGALGNVKVARTITVNSGAALSFAAANVTGAADTTPAATLVVNAGGVVNGATNQYNSLGPVTLVGGTINTLGGFSSSYGGFGLRGTVTTLASSATATLASPSGANSFYNLLASGTFNVADGAAATDLLVSGAISGTGSVALTKTGAGTMELSGNNTFTQGTQINAGTLLLSNTGALGSSGTISFGGGTLRFSGSNTVDYSGRIKSSSAAISIDTNGQSATFGSAIDSTNSVGLTKIGSGTLTLSGSNTYTGPTTAGAGVLRFNALAVGSGTQSLGSGTVVNLGVAGTSAGELEYFAATSGTLDKNVFALGTGRNRIRNSGSGTLGLSGTLTKNGTILELAGGTFNVTGQITGSSQNSDLYVNGASVTLSNTNNNYNGPTYVYGGGTLTLGNSNVIPSGSILTLGGTGGGDTGTGTLAVGSLFDSIGGLRFGSAGGTVRMTASGTAGSAQLTAPSGTIALAGGSLDLTGSGTTSGVYRLFSAQSVTGSFASITGTTAAYQVVTTSSSVDYQQRAVLGAVTVTNPASAIITGGSAAFTYTVANSALSGGADLNFSSGSLSNLAGSSSGTAAAGGPSGSISGLVFTGTSTGAGRTGTFTVTAPSAFGATTATGTVSVNVYDHAAGSAAGATIALSDSIVGYSGALTGLTSTTISNAAGYRVNLMTTGNTSAGFVNINNVSGVAAGSTSLISAAASLNGTQTVGANSLGQSFNLAYADDSNLAGVSNNLGSQSITVTGRVLDHATSSLGASLLTSTTVSLGTYNYATNTWDFGGATGFFDIHNIASSFGAGLTADLSLVNVTGAANGFTTNLISSYADIAGGSSQQFSIFFDPTGLNTSTIRSTMFTISMSDKTGMAGATASNTLYVTANVVVVPEPGAIALAGIGIAAAAWALRSRSRSRKRAG